MSKADDKQKKWMSPERRQRLANAERQRRFYWNRKAKLRAAPDPTDEIAKRKFFEFVAEEGLGEVTTSLEWAGINPDHAPAFETDDDPGFMPQHDDGAPRGSIGRAERMVENLLDAASELARLINQYKREEINRALAELEASDLADPGARKQALAEIVRLTKLREQLEKQHRHTLPQWRVTAL